MAWEEFLLHPCLSAGWFRWCGMLKIQLGRDPTFETESRCPTNRTAKSQLQTILTHLIHPMDDFGWLGKSFYCIHVWQQAGLGGALRHVENSARPTQLLRQNPDVPPTGRAKYMTI
jgi:hypothetical protein